MSFKDMIPWRRGRQDVPVYRADGERDADFDSSGDFGLAPFFRQTEELFDRFFQSFGGSFFPQGGVFGESGLGPRVHADLSETEDAFHVSIELPGVDDKDLDVSISGGALTVRGEKRSERKETKGDVHRTERSYGRFERTIPLPSDVEEDRIEASFRRGVLQITLPKSETAKERVKKVPVRVSET